MSGSFNPLTSKFGKGKNAPAPMATVAPSTNAPTFVTVELLDERFNQFGNQLMAVLANKLDGIATPAPVVIPVPVASETAQPADPDDWQTWTPERLQATGAGHEGKNNLVGIMTVIRDTLYPHWNDKGAVYPDDLKRLRLTAGNGGMNKAQKIETILAYRDAYVAHVEGSDPLPPVAPDNAPAPVAAPVSTDPATLLAWRKVTELDGKGYTKQQIIAWLLASELPNVLDEGNMPDPKKAIVLPAVKPETPAFLVALRDPGVQATKYANTKKHAATIRNLYEAAEKDIAKHKGNKEYAKIRWATYMEATKTVNGDSTDGCRTNPKSFSHYAALHNLENAVWGGLPSAERHANAIAKQAELDKKAK